MNKATARNRICRKQETNNRILLTFAAAKKTDKAKTVNPKFYSFFTKYSSMDNYGFVSGLLQRLVRKVIPQVPEEDTFLFYISQHLNKKARPLILEKVQLQLERPETLASIQKDLDQAVVALSSKIASFGLDHQLQTLFSKLDVDTSCYQRLMHSATRVLKEREVSIAVFYEILDDVDFTVQSLRKKKNVIGISLHLTVITREVLDYIKRIKKLLALKADIKDVGKWTSLINEQIRHEQTKNSLRKHVGAHIDLVALEIVEHTSQKGEKYVANDRHEYWRFFRKGLLGGAIIAFFALFKIMIDNEWTTPVPLALLYSINYAACFVLVKFLGGTIATKQPAMTASTIIKHIDKNDNLELDGIQQIVVLLRKVGRSQFISLIGNFLMAITLGTLIALAFRFGFDSNPISAKKANYLIEQTALFDGGALIYAAVAGVFLSMAGFISGYFDNKVIASNLPYRIQHNRTLSYLFTSKMKEQIGLFFQKHLGVIAGNVTLGFFLGSAFLLSYIMPFSVDIRHIAFSSANVGYGVVNKAFAVQTILSAIGSVLIIGLVNFLISFSITFMLTLKSRRITLKDLRKIIWASVKDFVGNPLNYLFIGNSAPVVIEANPKS